MKPILNAVLSCGLLNVPVGVATAAKEKEREFRTLHAKCLTPIKQSFHCPACDSEVGEDTVKGFEFVKGQFLVIPIEDLELMKPDRSKLIQVRKFVPEREVDPLFISKTYYLMPNATIPKAYEILATAMEKSKKVAVGTAVLWGKEHPCMISAIEGVLSLHMLFCASEVVSPAPIVERFKGVSKEEVGLGVDLIEALTQPIIPELDFVSQSAETVDEYLLAKAQGLSAELPSYTEQPELSKDVLDTLKESIQAAKKKTPRKKVAR